MIFLALTLNSEATTTSIGRIISQLFFLALSTCKKINEIFSISRTLIWNGPMGAFELEPFDNGTIGTSLYAGKLTEIGKLISVAGGGDTVSALKKSKADKKFSYVSLAGGAFLEWMEGKSLPGIKCLL